MTAYISAGENIDPLLRLLPFQPAKYGGGELKDGGNSIWMSYREIVLSSLRDDLPGITKRSIDTRWS